jgi:hypothetical protein
MMTFHNRKTVRSLYLSGVSIAEINATTGISFNDISAVLRPIINAEGREAIALGQAMEGFFNVDDEPDWLCSDTDTKKRKAHEKARQNINQ